MKPACSANELKQLLNDVAFTRNFGFALHEIADGQCSIDVAFQEAFERPGGIVSGQVFMAAADVAMWLAIMTQRGITERWVTTDMKTAFLSSARETDIYCAAQVLKLGKRTAYGSAECRDSGGRLLAHHVISYALVQS